MAISDNARDARAAIEDQLADMRSELSRLSKSFQERASDAADGAEEMLGSVRSKANGAARTMRRQVHTASEAIGENPGTAAAVLSSAGVVGLLIGLAAGYVLAGGLKR